MQSYTSKCEWEAIGITRGAWQLLLRITAERHKKNSIQILATSHDFAQGRACKIVIPCLGAVTISLRTPVNEPTVENQNQPFQQSANLATPAQRLPIQIDGFMALPSTGFEEAEGRVF